MGACPVCLTSWVPFPSTANEILVLWKWRREDSKAKAILNYIMTSIRDTGPVSEDNKIKMKYEINIFKDIPHSRTASRSPTK